MPYKPSAQIFIIVPVYLPSPLCHAAVLETFHFSGWWFEKILRKTSPLRTTKCEVRLLAQYLLKGSVLEMRSTWCIGKEAWLDTLPLGPCPERHGWPLPRITPSSAGNQRDAKGEHHEQPGEKTAESTLTPALLHCPADFSGCWIHIFEGQIYLQLNKHDKSYICWEQEQKPSRICSHIISTACYGASRDAALVMGRNYGWIPALPPPWPSSTAGASHSHIAGGERYTEL